MEEVFYIKNMVCRRCVDTVRRIFGQLGVTPVSVDLGCVRLSVPLDPDRKGMLKELLGQNGFSLLEEPHSQLAACIKGAVIDYVRGDEQVHRDKMSDYISQRLNRDYSSLSKLFSEVCGITVEKFFIAQRIEYVKELLEYGEMSLSEIACRLGYSSAAYLSSQFKNVTGMTPGEFRSMPVKKRRPLDSI